MEIIVTKNLIIRNYTDSDIALLKKLDEENVENVDETMNLLKDSFNDDLDSDGEKHFAIEMNGNLIGRLDVNIQKLVIHFSHFILPNYETRQVIQELVINVVKYLHILYHHRELTTYAERFDLKTRGVLETLGFTRKFLDKEKELYTYSLFVPNPHKDK